MDRRLRPGSLGSGAGGPLSRPPGDAEVLRYRASLAVVREFTSARARRAGLPPRQVNDLVIAVAELAANTLAHTSEPGTLTLWVTDHEVICQVQDQGQITDPLAGRVRPAPDADGGGRGLWVVHQVCDLVELRAGRAGTIIRVHMRRGSRRNPRLPRRAVSARAQEDEGVARLGVWGARGCYRDQGAFGVDQEQQVGGRGGPPPGDWVVMRASAA
jgi:anti-sigma regulatory factor (Ser/Thr protein kinase)